MERMLKVLVVDDDQLIADNLEYNLQKAGFSTVAAYDGESALEMARAQKPHVVVLDIMLPGMSGWEVCHALRQDPKFRLDAPILMLTARGEEDDCVQGLSFGADDFLVKPYRPRELVARVQSLIRRADMQAGNRDVTYRAGNIYLNPARRETYVQEEDGSMREVKLTNREFDLFKTLILQKGKAVSHEDLIEEVWGIPNSDDRRHLAVCMFRLRDKLEADPENPKYIVTVRGYGYKCVDTEYNPAMGSVK